MNPQSNTSTLKAVPGKTRNPAPVNPACQDYQALALLRIWHITGCAKRGIEPLLPIGRTTFLNRVRERVYPQPVRLGRITAWRKADIMALLESFTKEAA